MKFIIGLGNPSKKYEKTRHNIGFLILDALAKEAFKKNVKFLAKTSSLFESPEKVLLVKPQTFMNDSGNAVGKLVNFYKLKPERDILLVYDDIDILFGEIRLRESGASGGHKGVASVIETLGTDKFPRLRFGIRNEFVKNYKAADFVLTNFSAVEQKKLKELINKSCQAISFALKYDFVSAMNKFN